MQVMKLLLVKLVEITAGATDGGELPRKSNPIGLWSWALQYEYRAYFEVRTKPSSYVAGLIKSYDSVYLVLNHCKRARIININILWIFCCHYVGHAPDKGTGKVPNIPT